MCDEKDWQEWVENIRETSTQEEREEWTAQQETMIE